ncbi:hypothetical protein BO78DRAFT_387802 [Aspergillus sclerotiicarbonarius CBS 121057]|uniref:AP-1 complex subunit sigma-1 n=4 Tax=Aspergillus TaxID=5052 RepID=A0A319EBG9_ASPSB|nr:hypothetical protein BO78DRAFT_387802 [Aspergillus sclerotiicarbonarius CBS 121057]
MAIHYLILLSRQGKVRLAKWFTTLSPKEKAKIIKDVTQLVLSRRTRMCNFLEYKDTKVVYRRYASLFFIAGCASTDNELITLEVVHRYVEQMDKYYGNVCELDIIFNFQKAYFILDELLLAGEMQESSKKNVLRCISQQDSLEDMEVSRHLFLDDTLSGTPGWAGDEGAELGCIASSALYPVHRPPESQLPIATLRFRPAPLPARPQSHDHLHAHVQPNLRTPFLPQASFTVIIFVPSIPLSPASQTPSSCRRQLMPPQVEEDVVTKIM